MFQRGRAEVILAGSSGSNEVKMFSGASLDPVSRVHSCKGPVYTVDFDKTGDLFCMSGKDGVIRLFDIFDKSNS